MEQNTLTEHHEPNTNDAPSDTLGSSQELAEERALIDTDASDEIVEDAAVEDEPAAEHDESFHPLELLEDDGTDEEVTNRIFTVANVISLIRLCLVPVFVVLIMDGHNLMATFVFALAAGTDFVDGYVARSTHSVSRLGRVLDPIVDRVLMISGVICVYLIGQLPLWIIVVIILRDVMMLIGGSILLAKYHIRIPVILIGKAATASLFLGFIGLMLNWPTMSGLGILNVGWLPGFNSEPCSWGIWFVYLGLFLGFISTTYYVTKSLMKAGAVKGDTGD